MRRVLVLGLLLLLAGALLPAQQVPVQRPEDIRPTVLLVSLDGWRWDYHTRVPARNLDRLIARGVRAEGLIPVFPSKTFPNHYSIVTGLYAGHHGIVANSIRDAASGRLFAMNRRDEVSDAMWWGGEPIWVTLERAGQRTAPYFWVGSEAPIDGRRPSFMAPYDEDMPASSRIQWVLERLDLPADQRPVFLTLYFEDVDTAGHAEGPDSQAVRDATIRVDSYLGQLVAGLERRNLADRVNIVIVSDHGMAAVDPGRVVVLDDYIADEDAVVVDINPTLGLYPAPGREEAVYRALSRAHPRLRVYRRAATPRHWQYRDHPRIPPIVGVVDEGWQILRRSAVDDIASGKARPSGGQHGYDPRLRSMHGLFVAAGPAFRAGVTVPAFENVHVYHALTQVLGVRPAPNDGNPRIARRLLR